MKIFQGNSANNIWVQISSSFSNKHDLSCVESRIGNTNEILCTVIEIYNPKQRWIVSRVPAINPAFALIETLWIIAGRNEAQLINFFNNKYSEYAGKHDTYYGAYGYRLRHSFNIDQIERAYYSLKKNPYSRQVVLQYWNPKLDLPYKDGKPKNTDIPCNITSMLKVRDKKLEWTQIMRSNDVFRGLPYNIIQFTTLQEIIAGWLGLEIGSYNHISDSLHLYNKDQKNILKTKFIEEYQNTDNLSIPKNDFEYCLKLILRKVDNAIVDNIKEQDMLKLCSQEKLPTSYYNVLLIIFMEIARRKKMDNLINIFYNQCTNKLFLQLWDKWAKRVSRSK